MSTHQINRIHNGRTGVDGASDWQGQMEQCQQAVVDTFQKNPVAATLVVFGVGFTIGTAIGSMLTDSHDMRSQRLAKSLGRRMLSSVNDYLPDGMQIS